MVAISLSLIHISMRRGRAEECRSELVSDDHPMSLAGDLKIKGAFGPGVSVASVKNSILVKARRDVIVQAAVEVFFEKGYHVSRVLDVAKAAGVSHGTIYNLSLIHI